VKIHYRKDEIHMDGRKLTKIDRFVLDFIDVIQHHSKYVIVSGYVSILFGRSRGGKEASVFHQDRVQVC